jgi:hypothetical protein
LAFCAIIHAFHPDLIDFDKLNPLNEAENLDIAFNKVGEEKLGF